MLKRLLIFLTLMVMTIGGINIDAQEATNNNYTAENNKIYLNNQEIQLNGISWSGSEGAGLVPDGLWKRNYKEVIAQIKEIGFNAIRYPFCPSTLKNLPTQWVNYSANPTLKDKKSLEVMDIILDEFKNKGIYILLDHHRPDCEKISDLWYTDIYSEQDWISDLTFVANRYKSNPFFMGIDIKNEPHGTATWGDDNPLTDFNHAAERAAILIGSVNPNILTFIEGVGNNKTCEDKYEKWWGGNLSPIQCTPLDYTGINPKKIVFSPHVYGPDVYNQNYLTGDLDASMPAIWESHFGFLTKTGVTVVPGEFGGFYKPGSKDREWQDAIINYFIDKKICNTFYWVLNPNSGDTGGILSEDWLTVNTDKVNNLKRLYKACNPKYNPLPYKQINQKIEKSKITAKFIVNASGDWGYCGDINVTNTNYKDINLKRIGFTANIKPKDVWSGTLQKSKYFKNWIMSPNQIWNKTIETYTTKTMGYCSTTPMSNDSLPKNFVIDYN